MDGFSIGMPPTEAIDMKKNTIATSIRQNPMEYISWLLKFIITFELFLFSSSCGIICDPIKKAINAIMMVSVKLKLSLFKANSRKTANATSTIRGEKIYLSSILFFLIKLKKWAEGYSRLKK